jgi:CRISPR system Cascade subunit CasE
MNELYISAIRIPADSGFAAMASQELYKLHQLVYGAFPSKEAAKAARVLFRFDLEGDVGYLYVQSRVKPDWSKYANQLGENLRAPVPLVIPPDDRFRFRLLAKPTKRVGARGAPNRGKRVSLDEPEQRAWLDRKGEENGFRIEACTLIDRVWYDTKTVERLPNGSPKPLHAVQFDGILVVTDPDKLREAVRNGIGPQKAYGFGLLSIAPLRE